MVMRILCATALTALLCVGCQTSETSTDNIVSPGAVSICTNCGDVKGSDTCCAPDAVTCGGCGLHKGSIGCCQIEKGSTETVMVCTSCGYFKGSDECCQDGGATCAGCGLKKGSPGCCKIDI